MGRTYSLNSLPVELMEEIFLYYLSGCSLPFYPDIRQGPLFLCRISSSWRRLLLNITSIWDNLKVTYQIGRTAPLKPPTQCVKTWFEKAGPNRLLSLVVVVCDTSLDSRPSSPVGDYTDLLTFILSIAHRFRAIAVDDSIFSQGLLQAFFTNSQRLFTNLQTLYLRHGRLYNMAGDLKKFHPPETLRSLSFGKSSYSSDRFYTPIPEWARYLTHLDVAASFTPKLFIDQLRECPLLVSCHMHVEGTELPSQTSSPVLLAYLQHLGLYINTVDLKFLSTHITNLSGTLSSLRLRSSIRVPTARLYSYHVTPHHLGTKLTKLSLELIHIYLPDLETILFYSPGITELFIHLSCLTGSSIARLLTRGETNTRLQVLPLLTHLTLYILTDIEKYDPNIYARMILSRRADHIDEPRSFTRLKDATLTHIGSGDRAKPEIESLKKMLREESLRGSELSITDAITQAFEESALAYESRRHCTPEEWLYGTTTTV